MVSHLNKLCPVTSVDADAAGEQVLQFLMTANRLLEEDVERLFVVGLLTLLDPLKPINAGRMVVLNVLTFNSQVWVHPRFQTAFMF